jgi:AcrR family transcriptional regulator
VRYYFGDKTSLFTEVILCVADELRGRMNALPQSGPALGRLRDQLGAWLATFLENPHFHDLVVDRVFYGEDPAAQALVERFVIHHVVLGTPDVDAGVAFYTKRLGFRITDVSRGLGVFMRCDGRNDYDNLFLLKTPKLA